MTSSAIERGMPEEEAGIGPVAEQTPKHMVATLGGKHSAESAAGGSIYRTKAENAIGENFPPKGPSQAVPHPRIPASPHPRITP